MARPVSTSLPFSRAGFLLGVRRTVPVALSDGAVAVVFGVLARQAGLTPLEGAAMSALVFAGSAQFVALGLWSAVPPVGTLILTTLIINLRSVLQGAALQGAFMRLEPVRAYCSLFFMVDESWALSVAYFRDGGDDRAFLLGSGLVIYLAWVGGTVIGSMAGNVVGDPARLGLDFAITAVFLALLVGLWKGKSDLLPWAVAAAVAVAAARWLPGTWYILLGTLAGSTAGALRHGE